MLQKIKSFCRREMVMTTALVLAVASSAWHLPDSSCIDWDVLMVLFALMLVVTGLKKARLLDYLAAKLLAACRSWRQATLALTGVTFVASMLVTNDVALFTFVPLALAVGRSVKMDMARVIIIQTLSANLGSMFTPFGNPQNLFLYAHYGLSPSEFLLLMLPPMALAAFYCLFLVWCGKNCRLVLQRPQIPQPQVKTAVIYCALLVLNILAVLHIVDKNLALAVTLAVVALMDAALLKQADYALLVTFIGFFIFIGNIAQADFVAAVRNSFLQSAAGTYFSAVAASQFISNVPAAMLLAGLTDQAKALLLGVNIGGLGTLVASMASLISYKLFVAEHPAQAGNYLRMFLFYNFSGLVILAGAVYILCVK